MQEKKIKQITWIDLENPTPEELRLLIEKYDLDPLIADELLSPTLRPHVDIHKSCLYLILHFPHLTDINKLNHHSIQEVDFVIGKDYIITTHYSNIDALNEFSKIFEVDSIIAKDNMGDHAGYVFFYMLRHLYKESLGFVDQTRDLLNEAEELIFSGQERDMVIELSRLHRAILAYKEAFSLHKDVLESLEDSAEKFFDKKFLFNIRTIVGEYYKIQNAIESNREYLHELRDTNDSLLSTKQNEIMKTLTVVTFVMLPLSLIAGIFGMNAIHMPFVGQPNDFLIIISFMALLVIVMIFYFKKKNWL